MKKANVGEIRISVEDASKLLGIGRPALTRWLKSGDCPFGNYMIGEGKRTGTLYVNRRRLERYLSGEDMQERRPFNLTAMLDSLDAEDAPNPADYTL